MVQALLLVADTHQSAAAAKLVSLSTTNSTTFELPGGFGVPRTEVSMREVAASLRSGQHHLQRGERQANQTSLRLVPPPAGPAAAALLKIVCRHEADQLHRWLGSKTWAPQRFCI